MKKQYDAPQAEIEEFEMDNTLCTSGCSDPGNINPIGNNILPGGPF